MRDTEKLHEQEAALQRQLVALGRAYQAAADDDERAALLVEIVDTRNRMNAMRRRLGKEEIR